MSIARKRSGGRRAKAAQRAAPPPNPCPPGQNGGQYKPLNEVQIEQIYGCALQLLDGLGMGEVPDRLRNDLLLAGAVVSGDRVTFPNALVEDAIAQAAKTFVLHGRDENRSIQVGGQSVFFGSGGAAVQTLDMGTGLYRPSTLQDLHDFTRLQDALENISWFTRCCIATDMPDEWSLDVNTLYALVRGTTKPVGTAFTLAAHVTPLVEMLDLVAGGEGAFSRRPFVKAHISPVISPMRYGADAVDVLYECIAHNIPVSCITAAQSGATAPATLAGFLAQSLAETLASLVMVHAIKPGHPMVFSNWPFVIDLRSGAFAGGGAEVALMNAASAQLSNWLGLPSGVASSMTDAKAIDAQYGVEKGMTALAAALGGGNLIYESAGMTASLLGASFEAFVIDDETNAAAYRVLRGVEVNEETLGYQAICDTVLGDGHFLGSGQTYAAMERDYYYPTLADRDAPITWAEAGAPELWGRARSKAIEILNTHHPQYLTPDQDEAIRRRLTGLV
ncbi:trimethylamine methyltransferase family protein [Thalassococcus lentus]|uniref:Trimethylamine methyltransferase family protein n=1 Tax=Thalassococcus lentus TaxID=1210524 RepID=A0ABT4XQX2_9RHOB|nr:trimethylamine methyltransferase family protein [Thalassococcus lentus]MDA7424346.1 trimethylamine methyltransferase family protein [Thalassococcus lentus]